MNGVFINCICLCYVDGGDVRRRGRVLSVFVGVVGYVVWFGFCCCECVGVGCCEFWEK